MPHCKKTRSVINKTLQNQCRQLIKGDEKREISNETGYGVSTITAVISGDRYNITIIKALEKKVGEKITELTQ